MTCRVMVFDRVESIVRRAVERAREQCPGDAETWHRWAKRWLDGDWSADPEGARLEAAALQGAQEERIVRREAPRRSAAGYSAARAAAEAVAPLVAALRGLEYAEHTAKEVPTEQELLAEKMRGVFLSSRRAH